MKVLFITHYSSMYGANKSLINLIEGLRVYDVDILVLCPEDGALVENLKNLNVNHIVRKFSNAHHKTTRSLFKVPFKLFSNLIFLLKSGWVKEFAPDVIYSNSSVVFIGSLLSWKYNIPHIWHIREFGYLDYKLKFDFGSSFLTYWRKKTSKFICISNAISETVLPNVSIEKKFIIYNGIVRKMELEQYTVRSLKTDQRMILGIVGLVSPVKNQLEAIRAFAIVNKVYPLTVLRIIGDGDGEYLDLLSLEAGKLGVRDSVIFEGYMSDPSSVYDDLDILLMCSRNEGMGRVTVEAMSRGIPTVGYANGGTLELINDGQNGFLYNNGYEKLSSKVMELLGNKSLYIQMSEACLREVERKFTVEEYSKKVSEVLFGLKN
ncbi:glycosyltransferase family 4 protein [Fulvivirga ligni]|uniref:glycosyltransferase family 4 protein n=1 Tax=Fulvivirga ligni TaxID=2904246 RepID=UPI001F35F82C|nr:glycosyltransferase family 4 protein [Fulvivirga ligni]UII22662.1 glycosyltransferase family 4 protein [Fulvivirga ligni]